MAAGRNSEVWLLYMNNCFWDPEAQFTSPSVTPAAAGRISSAHFPEKMADMIWREVLS